MPRQTASDKLNMLRRQQADIAARLKEAEAKARARSRDDESRREKLVGRCALVELDRNPDGTFSQELIDLLHKTLTRPADRALFAGLEERADPDKEAKSD